MTTSPKLKIGSSWMSTFGNWGSELRKIKFLTRDDFTLNDIWNPTVTTSAGTYAATVVLSRFWVRDGLIEFMFGCTGTTATAAATEVYFTLPPQYPPDDATVGYTAFAATIDDNASGWLGASAYLTTENRVAVARYNRAALAAPPVALKIACRGKYKVA